MRPGAGKRGRGEAGQVIARRRRWLTGGLATCRPYGSGSPTTDARTGVANASERQVPRGARGD